MRMTQAWLAATLTLGLGLSAPAQAQADLENLHLPTTGCSGCPKGDKAQLNPTVLEYLLADKESVVRVHYEALGRWDKGGKGETSNNPLIMTTIQGELEYLYKLGKPFIDEETGTSDITAALHADEDGTVFARAVARYTAPLRLLHLNKKGRVQYWGTRWENAGTAAEPQWKTPTVFGASQNVYTVDEAAQTVSAHIWGKGMVTVVRTPYCTYDLSGVEGAFDGDAEIAFEDVAKGIKRTEGKLAVDFDESGLITGASKR